VPVDPDLHRPGAVSADLDERRAELRVLQVEVIDRDPAVFLVKGELRALARVGGALAGDEHPLHLLRHPDRRDLRAARGSSPFQVGTHHLDVAVSGLQRHHRNVISLSERRHPAAEGVPDLLQARRGRHRVPAMTQELDHLAAHLQRREVAVQVEPVQALQVERNMAVQRIHHRHDIRAREP
jgi:hypothetical protein